MPPPSAVAGVCVNFDRDPPRGAMENIMATLELVPYEHRALINRIDVFTPPRAQPGQEAYSGGGSGQGYPRLSVLCFDRPRNRQHNKTLLHEIGHIIDQHYHCSDWLIREGSQYMQALQRNITISSRRRTRGNAEYFADGYQQVMSRTARPEVREAILATPAFASPLTRIGRG